MPLDKEAIKQLEHLFRPVNNRISNLFGRGVVQRVNDGTKLQLVQLGVLAGETVEGDKGSEHFQPYGFSSVPIEAAEAVVIFLGADRGHPITIAVSDRRYRPVGGQPGEVTVYNDKGAKITLTKDGDIEVQPGPGGKVYVRSDGGASHPLVTKSDFDAHTHPAPGGATSAPTAPAAGTSKLEAE